MCTVMSCPVCLCIYTMLVSNACLLPCSPVNLCQLVCLRAWHRLLGPAPSSSLCTLAQGCHDTSLAVALETFPRPGTHFRAHKACACALTPAPDPRKQGSPWSMPHLDTVALVTLTCAMWVCYYTVTGSLRDQLGGLFHGTNYKA